MILPLKKYFLPKIRIIVVKNRKRIIITNFRLIKTQVTSWLDNQVKSLGLIKKFSKLDGICNYKSNGTTMEIGQVAIQY